MMLNIIYLLDYEMKSEDSLQEIEYIVFIISC